MFTYLDKTVWEAGLERMRYVFDEFPQVVVATSGGKDSTVLLNLALMVAAEKGRLPLPVLFLDQEAEWDCVITYVRAVMYDPRVTPMWFQAPFRIFNAASESQQQWLECWKPGDTWIRQKDPIAIHENRTGCDRFHELFTEIGRTYFGGAPLAELAGVRCEESPARLQGLVGTAKYKDITWGKILSSERKHYTFYPLYDWTWRDIWKAIHDNGWPYCRLYDYMHQYGIKPRDMRVSNVTHETALRSLWFLQEIEPETWDRITARLAGVNAVAQMPELYYGPGTLPKAFRSWREYRTYLLDNLIEDPENRERFRRQFRVWEKSLDPKLYDDLMQVEIRSILTNDYHGTKGKTYMAAHARQIQRRGKRGDQYSYENLRSRT